MYRKTYVEINVNHIKENVNHILNYYNDYQYYIGVVKGNAYGHGYGVIATLIENGINYLAVSSLEEGLAIRTIQKEIPILCLEPIELEFIDLCEEYQITIMIPSYEYYKQLMKLNKKLKVHLKLDTGMNRLGLKTKEEVKEIFDNIKDSNMMLEGIFTHLQTTGVSDKYYDDQICKFEELTSLIDLTKIPIRHIGRSLTLINHERISFCNGIRLGIILYGFDQTPKKQKGLKAYLRKIKANMRKKKYHISPTIEECPITLKPAFSLISEVIHINTPKPHAFVGYGTCYEAKENEKIAVIPIGYADGISRRSSGREVLIQNKRFPIVGDVNMGMILVSVDDSVNLHDKVEIIGDTITVREVSHHLHTTVYEVMCMIDSSLPRIYKE